MSHLFDKYDIFMKMLEIIEQDRNVDLPSLSNEQAQKAKIVIERLNLFQEQTIIEKIEGDNVMSKAQKSEHNIEVLLGDNARILGDFVVAESIKNSFNKVASADISDELKNLLQDLSVAVGHMSEQLPKNEAEEASEDLSTLVEQATRENPKRKWWSVSVEGLTKAAENIGKIGQPVLELIGKIVPLLDKIST